MKKVSPLLSIGVRNGAIAGVLAIALLIATYYLGLPIIVSPFVDFRILLFSVFIFFSLKELRDVHQEGVLYFSQGMMLSFVMIMVTGILSSILLLAFCSVESTFIDSYIKTMTEFFQSFSAEEIARYGKDTYERNLVQLPSTNSVQITTRYYIHSLSIGLFVSIILSVILRKQPNPK